LSSKLCCLKLNLTKSPIETIPTTVATLYHRQ
jgi:hypothetical protein